MENAVRAAAVPPPGQARPPAIVHAAIFDAVNGIVRQYAPYFVTEPAPGGGDPGRLRNSPGSEYADDVNEVGRLSGPRTAVCRLMIVAAPGRCLGC